MGMARLRLLQHVLAPEQSTTPLPPSNAIKRIGAQEGYPPWLINQMLRMEGMEGLDADDNAKKATLIQDAAERAKRRAELEVEIRAAANAASGLPKTQMDLLLGVPPTKTHAGVQDPLADIFNGSCRSVIASTGGEIIGQLLGDCVGLEASHPLVNAVELCVPLTFSGQSLLKTEIGQYVGIVFDFARKGTVPTNYTTFLP